MNLQFSVSKEYPMKKFARLSGAIGLPLLMASCGFLAETTIATMFGTDSGKDIYDREVCMKGDPSPPGVERRMKYDGELCVNDLSRPENDEAFRRYELERELYLDNVK